jgi:hypothetical protein
MIVNKVPNIDHQLCMRLHDTETIEIQGSKMNDSRVIYLLFQLIMSLLEVFVEGFILLVGIPTLQRSYHFMIY